MSYLCLFHRFHMDGYMGTLTETLLQLPFDIGSSIVGLREGETAIHAHMHLYGKPVAYATCAQIVRLSHIGVRLYKLYDFFLSSSRQ